MITRFYPMRSLLKPNSNFLFSSSTFRSCSQSIEANICTNSIHSRPTFEVKEEHTISPVSRIQPLVYTRKSSKDKLNT